MSNSRELAKTARSPLAVFAMELDETSHDPKQWSESLVDDMTTDLIANLLHFANTHGQRDAAATLALARQFYEQERQ
jgi:hypothetical protein